MSQIEKESVNITQAYNLDSQHLQPLESVDITTRYKQMAGSLMIPKTNSAKVFRKSLKKAVQDVKRGKASNLRKLEEQLNNILYVLSNETTIISRMVGDFEAEKQLLTEFHEKIGTDIDRLNQAYAEKREYLVAEQAPSDRTRQTVMQIESLAKIKQDKIQSLNLCRFYLEATDEWIDFGRQSYAQLKEKTRDLDFFIRVHIRHLELVDNLANKVVEAYGLLDCYFKDLVKSSRNYFYSLSNYNGKKVLSDETLSTLEGKLRQIKSNNEGLGRETIARLDKIFGVKEEVVGYDH